jgi:hypothetical protein
MKELFSSETFISTCKSTQSHNPQDQHRHGITTSLPDTLTLLPSLILMHFHSVCVFGPLGPDPHHRRHVQASSWSSRTHPNPCIDSVQHSTELWRCGISSLKSPNLETLTCMMVPTLLHTSQGQTAYIHTTVFYQSDYFATCSNKHKTNQNSGSYYDDFSSKVCCEKTWN